MKRRYLRIAIAGVIFLLALLLTLYPVISNLYNQEHQSQIQTAYREVLEQTDTEELERIREQAIAYNESSGVYATPPPAPPSVNAGRTMTG